MAAVYSRLLRRARTELVKYPTVFHVAKTLARAALIPRRELRRALHAWRTREFTDERIVDVNVLGTRFSIIVDPRNGQIDEVLFSTRVWAPELSGAVATSLATGATFVDVGANIGYFSLLAATVVGREGKVVAFEPIPHVLAQASRSADLNGLTIEFVASGCGDLAGFAALVTREGNIGASTLVAPGYGKQVRVTTLDEHLRDASRIDVIKIDIEGAEPEALRGATQTLARFHPTIYIEFSPTLYEQRDPGSTKRLIQQLHELGYAFEYLNGDSVKDIGEFSRELLMRGRQYDLRCVPAR